MFFPHRIETTEEFNSEVDKLRQTLRGHEFVIPEVIPEMIAACRTVVIDRWLECTIFKDQIYKVMAVKEEPNVGWHLCKIEGVVDAINRQPAPYVTFFNPGTDGFAVPAGTDGLAEIEDFLKLREAEGDPVGCLWPSYGDPELNGWGNLTLDGAWVVRGEDDEPIDGVIHHRYYDALVMLTEALDTYIQDYPDEDDGEHQPYIERVETNE